MRGTNRAGKPLSEKKRKTFKNKNTREMRPKNAKICIILRMIKLNMRVLCSWNPRGSQIEIAGLPSALHDEAEAGAGIAAHQVVDDAVGFQLVVDADFERDAFFGIERGRLELFGVHLAEPLESLDVWLLPPRGLALEDAVAVGVVEGPVGLLADVDSVERRLADEDAPGVDERLHVSIEKGEQERGDVVAVRVGVGEQKDAAIAKSREVAVAADAAAERLGDVLVFAVAGDAVARGLFGVQDFAAQGEDGLCGPVASLFGGAAGRVALDEEEFAFFGLVGGAVGELARQVEPPRDGALARDLLRRRP